MSKITTPRIISDLTGKELEKKETVEVRVFYGPGYPAYTIILDVGLDERFPAGLTVKALLKRGTRVPTRGRRPKGERTKARSRATVSP